MLGLKEILVNCRGIVGVKFLSKLLKLPDAGKMGDTMQPTVCGGEQVSNGIGVSRVCKTRCPFEEWRQFYRPVVSLIEGKRRLQLPVSLCK
jgi:hypothetical protein